MTKQDAIMLVGRLARIWEPDRIECRYQQRDSSTYEFHYIGDITAEDRPRISICNDGPGGEFFYSFYVGEEVAAAAISGFIDIEGPADIGQWLPFFRRGCWLSGCAIEASAHEKAEWMQGFTREELEAWI